ncbi:MAG: hypothetical protein NTX52_04625 [Planctomycetota bacterium]|nr:hypothetical protein [Planctomycetota bacterium]
MSTVIGEVWVAEGWVPIRNVTVDGEARTSDDVDLDEDWLPADPGTAEVAPFVTDEAAEVVEPEGGGAPYTARFSSLVSMQLAAATTLPLLLTVPWNP